MDLIDREQLKATIRKMVEIPNETRAQVIGAISRAKAVDVVEVVRCKDCYCWDKAVENEKGIWICPASGMAIMSNDFCSYGERRTDNA